MSYARKKQLSGNPIMAWTMTFIVVGGLLYAIVTGLAFNVVKKAAENLKVIDVNEQPPPPQKPPPPPKDMPKVPPPPVTPPPLVRMEAPPPPIQTVTAPPVIPPVVPPPPAPSPPPPPHKVVSAQSAKGDLRTLFSADDYPAAAQSAGAEGTVQASLTIGPDGRVIGCNIIKPSGNSSLDSTTCNILRRRAKFTPARDTNGNPTTDTVSTPTIVWRLEG